MPEKIKILYVDDEQNNLIGFKASFRIDYAIFIANNTTEAKKILEQHPDIRIIFCDQRMPDKTGVEFFEEIRLDHPHPIRILLTGYTDIESVIDAINRGNIYRYVKKPWGNEDIRAAIEESNKFYLANSMLAIKNTELQKAYTELDKFAYSVSHDIRGPLSGILGAIRVVKHLDTIEDMKEMLFLMENSVKKLDTFILSVHDYYNIQRGDLKISEIDLNTIAADLGDMYSMYTNAKNVSFSATVNQNEGFRSDEISVKLVLNNLLSNAFKYQRKDSPNKSVSLEMEVDKGIATFYVKDNGIGIDDKYRSEIFNLFFRATSQEAGSGFGLYNVKDALLKLNGNIEVNSVVGEGTIFKVTIPSK
ncbi:hybrid sensor histidine kinase/response regulator [Desertivirga xinjiangensis]|uniref:hybrid sensor histidine kinase/response regulator n=1 Tax=Desertivirga xinjiangensis TaxID=539206 RepID=UPI002109B218|nr:hybrid sensor histidine kinase/response regulator [Pedobacter xinjiangensis]